MRLRWLCSANRWTAAGRCGRRICSMAFKGNRSVILWLIHHCLVDGVSGMELLNVVMDFRPDPPAAEPKVEPWSPKRLPGPIRQLLGVAARSRAAAGRFNPSPGSSGAKCSIAGRGTRNGRGQPSPGGLNRWRGRSRRRRGMPVS